MDTTSPSKLWTLLIGKDNSGVLPLLQSALLSLQTLQVFPGTLSQHRGLLHQSSNREEDLHALHGRVQCHLHLNVHP